MNHIHATWLRTCLYLALLFFADKKLPSLCSRVDNIFMVVLLLSISNGLRCGCNCFNPFENCD